MLQRCRAGLLSAAALVGSVCTARALEGGGGGSQTCEVQRARIHELVKQYDAVVFSKSYCPYCTCTKDLFERLLGGEAMRQRALVVELDEIGEDGPLMQEALHELTQQRTVPSVWLKGEHVGGNDDAQRMARSGELQRLLDISGS